MSSKDTEQLWEKIAAAYKASTAFRRVWWPLMVEDFMLTEAGMADNERKVVLDDKFHRAISDWCTDDPDYPVAPEDIVWLAHITMQLGSYRGWLTDHVARVMRSDWGAFEDSFRRMNSDPAWPETLANMTPQQYGAVMLQIHDIRAHLEADHRRLPKGHAVWLAHGATERQELEEKGIDAVFAFAERARNGEVEGVARVLIEAATRVVGHLGMRTSHPSYLEEVPEQADQSNPYLDDRARLELLVDNMGIDIDDLTPSDQNRLLQLLDALDAGYQFSSKKGVSIKAFYGDRSDSEKSQRQLLFQKLRNNTAMPRYKE